MSRLKQQHERFDDTRLLEEPGVFSWTEYLMDGWALGTQDDDR